MRSLRRVDTRLWGLAALLVIAALFALSYTEAFRTILSPPPSERVSARFGNAGQLKPGDPVRIDGVKVGRVESITLDPGAKSTTVRMQVERKALPLHADARAKVAMRNVLGGSFYVDLERGTAASGALGSRAIPRTQTTSQVELEDLTSLNRGAARRGLETMPGELAETFKDRQVPAQSLETLADVSPELARGVGALRGKRIDEDLKQLIRASDRTVRNLDTPTNDLRAFVSGLAATLETTADREADLRYLFRASPAIQQRAQLTLRRLEATLRKADPLIARLRSSAADVAPTLATLRPPVQDTDVLLRDAVPLLESLRPASRWLAQLADDGAPVLDGLDPSLNRLATKILPRFNQKDAETQLTPAQAIGPTFSAWGGYAAQTDANGHTFRFPGSMGEAALSNDLLCRTHLTDPTASALAACDSFAQALQTYLDYSPLEPTPGVDNEPSPTRRSKRGAR